MKLNILKRRGFLILLTLLFVFSTTANALLKVTFLAPYNPANIDLFWSGDSTTPDKDGTKIISSDPTIDIDEATPGKPDSNPPVNLYLFWSGKSTAAETSTILRLWDDSDKPMGSHYTDILSLGNPSGAVVPANFSKPLAYIKANAGKPIITQYAETGTSVLSPKESFTKSVAFTSVQPKVGAYAVQLKNVIWNINGADQPATSSSNLTLATPTFTMDPGTTYTVKVKHQSYWGEYSAYSEPVVYSVGAGGPGTTGTPTSFTFDIKQYDSTNLVVNDISSPIDTKASALASKINSAANASVVSAICKWLPDKATYTVYVPGQSKTDDFAIKAGQGVQVYVIKDVTVKLSTNE